MTQNNHTKNIISGNGDSPDSSFSCADDVDRNRRKEEKEHVVVVPKKQKCYLYGSCLCGSIEYRVDVNTISSKQAHCHCIDCRKHCGSAFSTYCETSNLEFIISGTSAANDCMDDNSNTLSCNNLLKSYTSPQNGSIRQFCIICGSSLTYQSLLQQQQQKDERTKKHTIEFAMSTLDLETTTSNNNNNSSNDENINNETKLQLTDILNPDAHVYWKSKVPWIDNTILTIAHRGDGSSSSAAAATTTSNMLPSLPIYETSRKEEKEE